MKGVISRAVVAAALMTTFSAQALVSNTTKLANANSGVVAAQVNWFDFTGFNRTEAISAAGQAFTQTLPDGSVLKFTAKVSGPSTDVAAVVQRYWSASFYGTTTALLPDHANGFYNGQQWVLATPKIKDGQLKNVKVGFKDEQLTALEIEDSFGQRSVVRFTGLKTLPSLPASTFEFNIPSGAEVIRQ